MRLFLDSSVLLSASASAAGASRETFRLAPENGWTLLASPYVIEEVRVNLAHLAATATEEWPRLFQKLSIVDDVLTLDRASVFDPAKDRPILFSALAWADVLLTLDRGDFASLLGSEFYGLAILTPGMFLERERSAGRLRSET